MPRRSGPQLVSPAAEREVAARVASELDPLVAPGPDSLASLYWPFRGELDLPMDVILNDAGVQRR